MKTPLPGILAMAAIVVASNILVQHPLGLYLTWGALTYPLAFLVTDLTNRLRGPKAAARVILFGFVLGVACSVVGVQIDGPFGPLVTVRIALASGIAFLLAQALDVVVFHRLRQRRWWTAPLVSTLASSTLDTALFFPIAFSAALVWIEPANDVSWATQATAFLGFGPAWPLWASLAVADWAVKIALALIALVPFRVITGKVMARVA